MKTCFTCKSIIPVRDNEEICYHIKISGFLLKNYFQINERKKLMFTRNSCFALIELLVVIAIIALLLSILMPGLQKAKKMAKNVVCQSNMHQWGLIWAMFFQENDNKAIGEKNDEGGQGAESWPQILYDYYKSRNVRFCPETTRNEGLSYGDRKTAWNYGWGGGIEWAGGYGVNDWVYDGESTWGRDSGTLGWSSPDLPGATRNVPLFLDCVHIGSFADSANDAPPEQDSLPFYHTASLVARYVMDRHDKGRTNCLFLDGSARNVGLKEIWTLKWHTQFDIRGRYTVAGGATPDDWPDWMRSFKDY